jgi:HEAT repeat protein
VTRAARVATALALAIVTGAPLVDAQPVPRRPVVPLRPPTHHAPAAVTPAAAPTALRSRFGLEVALRMLRSADVDERLRGLERVAATRTPEALTVLEHAAGSGLPGGFDPRAQVDGAARSDPRALLVVVRGLATWIDREPARDALEAVLGAPTPAFASRLASGPGHDPAAEEALGLARVQLARRQAAIALAASGETQALEALVAAARAGGPAQAPALDALAMHPPSSGLLGGVVLTTPGMIGLAAEAGDLRSLGAILGALKASDPALRAAALAALGVMGDARVLEPAREAAKDKDPRVRLAAADALARLGAADAGKVLEALEADDTTARGALRIAEHVRDETVTKAAAARAAASADLDLQEAAVAALGRQTDVAAVTALVALAADVRLQGDAADALARSPSRAAMGGLEALGAAAATRRLAGRAYFVRRAVRGERSARLDALLAALATAADPRDRAVGIEALVALGERPLDAALADPDPRVRRAAAMGSRALPPGRRTEALLSRLAVEKDATTRQLLALGLADADPGSAMPTLALVDRAENGGPDAPLAALALARRIDDELRDKVDALLASRDPVLRAHVARGLAESRAPDATGRLAEAYLWEPDGSVRRALVDALAGRPAEEANAPARREALELAARLDPDRVVQAAARAALAGTEAPRGAPSREVAWLRLVGQAEGDSTPGDATGTLVDAEGVAWPIAFDQDGYALLPGLPAGEARLRLAPRVPAYDPR